MGLDDQTVDEGRRFILRAGLLVPAYAIIQPLIPAFAQDDKKNGNPQEFPVLDKSRLSFDAIVEQINKDPKGDKEGKYEALKYQYLRQLLVKEYKLVYDKEKNKDGFINEWFYLQDPKQKKQATERLDKHFRAEGEIGESAKYVKACDERGLAIELLTGRMPGQKLKSSFILTGKDLFGNKNIYPYGRIENEDDVFSTLDYISNYARAYEFGLTINGKEINFKNADLSFYASSIVDAHARSEQVRLILSGKRPKISKSPKSNANEVFATSDSPKTNAIEQYESFYTACYGFMKKAKEDWQKITDGGRLQSAHTDDLKEAADTLGSLIGHFNEGMKCLGYEHFLGEKEYHVTQTEKKKMPFYNLVPIKK